MALEDTLRSWAKAPGQTELDKLSDYHIMTVKEIEREIGKTIDRHADYNAHVSQWVLPDALIWRRGSFISEGSLG